jgi:hypothetical protein
VILNGGRYNNQRPLATTGVILAHDRIIKPAGN